MPWKVVAKSIDGEWTEVVVQDRKVAIDLMNDMCDSGLYTTAGVFNADGCTSVVVDDETLAISRKGA